MKNKEFLQSAYFFVAHPQSDTLNRMSTMTKADLVAYQARWKLVADVEAEELRGMSMETKLQQLVAMVSFAQQMGWMQGPGADDGKTCDRWDQLRRAFYAG